MDPKDYRTAEYTQKLVTDFKPGMDDTAKQTRALIHNDPEIAKLAKLVAKEHSPEAISRFVAAVEKKIDKFTYDMPNWTGNQFFDGGGGNKFVKTDKYVQLDCIREAANTGSIVMALKDEGYLPKDTSWRYVTHEKGNHWAPVILQESKPSEAFILDTWLVPTGTPGPTFMTKKDWHKGVEVVGDSDSKKIGTDRKAFYRQLSALQKPAIPVGGLLGELLPAQGIRKFDKNFLIDWQVKKLTFKGKVASVLYDGNLNAIGNHEAEQDLFTVKYYLGNPPELPAAQMPTVFFESLRDRMAHIITEDKDNPAVKTAGLSAPDIKKTKNFEELKPMAVKFYTAYGALEPNAVKTQVTPEQMETMIRKEGDLNHNGMIEYGEARIIAEALRKPLKDMPQARAVFDALPWKDISVDEAVSAVKSTMAPRKPEVQKR